MRLVFQYLLEALFFSLGVLIISLGYMNNYLTGVLLLVLLGLELIVWHEKMDILIFFVGAIVGPIAEVIAIAFGAWNYANPTVFGIPIWLPLAWGIITLSINRISNTLYTIFK